MTLQRFAAALLIGLAAVVTFSPFPVAAAETRKCLSKVSLIDIGRGKWITSEVRDVQLFLKDLGHYVPDIKESDLTGRIGTRTKAAISSFQKSEGLEATGSIGPLTAERIHQISCGMQVAAPVVATKASTSGVKSPTPRSERAAAPQNDRDDTGPGIDDTTPVRGSAPTITSISSSAGGAPITGIAAWAVTGSTIEVRGTNFNANTRAVIDGDWGAAIAPDRFTAQSFTFEVPSLSLGRHTLRLGDMRNRSSVSNEAHIVIAPPRRVTLYAGGNTGDDVYEVSAGQSVTYELRAAGLEGPDPRASGAYTVTNNGTNCNGPRSGVWNAPSAGTSRTDTVATCQAGTTYRLTYTYSPDGVRTASTHATVKVLAATTTPVSTGPTAQFTANGAQSITVSPGDTIRYRWSSTGATRFVSSYSSDQAACGAASTAKWWADGTASGERTDTVSDCQAGRLYTLTYDVSNTSGQTARSTVTVRVLSLTNSVPTATLTANGATDITVNVGDTVRYAWTSTGGRSYVSNVIADQPSCGSPANTTWWANGTASGERTDTVAECQAGRTYTISYDVITGVQSAHAQVTVRVRSVSQSLPSAAFTANGATDITVNAGDQITYAWSSSGATSASSRWSSDQASCGAGSGGTWEANTTGGSRTDTVGECQAGRTYTITYAAANAAGAQQERSVTVRVRPLVKFTANGGTVVSVNPGGSVTYALEVLPAEAISRISNAYATYTRVQTDACGPAGENGSWTPPALNGSRTDTASTCQAGGGYRITYHYVLDGRTEEKSVLVSIRSTSAFRNFGSSVLGSVFNGFNRIFGNGRLGGN